MAIRDLTDSTTAALFRASGFDEKDFEGPVQDPDAFLEDSANKVKAIDYKYDKLNNQSQRAGQKAEEFSSIENPNPYEQQAADHRDAERSRHASTNSRSTGTRFVT